MQGYLDPTEQAIEPAERGAAESAGAALRRLLGATSARAPNIKEAQLHYIRQITGKVDGKPVVYYFEPEFLYVFDIGAPRLALMSVPYQIPTVYVSGEHRPVGRGDGEFPNFGRAQLFSGASHRKEDLLFPAVAGMLLIGAKDGVTEDQLRSALGDRVSELTADGPYYKAKVAACHETEIAAKILAEVNVVRYAELNRIGRNNSAPWSVDRVL